MADGTAAAKVVNIGHTWVDSKMSVPIWLRYPFSVCAFHFARTVITVLALQPFDFDS